MKSLRYIGGFIYDIAATIIIITIAFIVTIAIWGFAQEKRTYHGRKVQ